MDPIALQIVSKAFEKKSIYSILLTHLRISINYENKLLYGYITDLLLIYYCIDICLQTVSNSISRQASVAGLTFCTPSQKRKNY